MSSSIKEFYDDIMRKINDRWKELTLKERMSAYVGMIILFLTISVSISLYLLFSYLNDFNRILEANSYNQRLTIMFQNETENYYNLNSLRNETNKKAYTSSSEETREIIESLPYDISSMSRDRYIVTQAILNSYKTYKEKCEEVLSLEKDSGEYLVELYESYKIQGYIEQYITKLVNLTLEENDYIYSQKLSLYNKIPYLIFFLAMFFIVFTIIVGYSISRSVLNPVTKLADMADRISKEEYNLPDIQVDNEDEIGKLTHTFNSMKHSTYNAILALKEKNEIESKLHMEIVEHMKANKLLDDMKMKVLQSQVNPHFLFNTLNVISGMARIEDALSTDEMIRKLSGLLRYNLRTNTPAVSIAKELEVMDNYGFIQKKRFGARVKIEYDIDSNIDIKNTMIPAFTLQPIVENCIIHGIGHKEDGGEVVIKIFRRNSKLYILISDTGVGIDRNRLLEIRQRLKKGHENSSNIGVANVCGRCKSLFPGSRFNIYSKENEGTSVLIIIKEGSPKP